MDEYQLEIQQLRRQLAALRESEADASLVAEYEAEVRNLTALYNATRVTFDAGRHDQRLPQALASLGFGGWTMEHVYSFVYDASMDMQLDGAELSALIDATDYAASLLAALGA